MTKDLHMPIVKDRSSVLTGNYLISNYKELTGKLVFFNCC